VWDFNQDGYPDIFVGNDFLSQDRLWKNNGNGTFTNVLAEMAPHTCWFSMGADQGDLNNDLHPDFLLADMAATTHYKSKTTMGAMGGIQLTRAVGSQPAQYMRNTCLIGTGTERFQEAAYLLGIASTDWTWAIKFVDFDLDGWQDIYVTNGVIRAMNHSDFKLDESKLQDRHLWEFYKDQEKRPEQHRAYKNEGHLHFADVSAEWGLDRTAVTYGCAYGDLDGDGDLDLVECNLEEPPTIYRNLVKGNNIAFRLVGNGMNRDAVGAKIVLETAAGKQVRQLFPTSGYHSCNDTLLQFGLGTETAVKSVAITWADGTRQVLAEADRIAGKVHTISYAPQPGTPPPAKPQPMFAEAKDFPVITHEEKPYDDYGDQILLPHAMSKLGPAMAWGDVNGDGHQDVYLGGGAGQAGQLRLGNGKGGLKAAWVDAFDADKAHEDMGCVFFDADGDKDLDLYVASGSYQFKRGDALLEDRLYLNDGKGEFSKAPEGTLPRLREASGPVAVADYDKDGDLDVYVGSRVVSASYPEVPVSRLLQNNRGKFKDVTDAALKTTGMVSAATWSDVNGDGWQDLVLAHEWGRVALFLNKAGKLEERTGVEDDLAANTGWWLSVETADIDADGDLDILAGNFGYNTKYKEATKEKPKLLYYADFDDTGRKNIVEVKREGDTLFPERGRSCSSTAMPKLKQKFPTYEQFAKATLTQVYGDKLDKALKLEANTLGSGVFVNDGGKFTFQPFDRLAQVSPVFGIAVADFNGDGVTDVFLAQNFHSPQIETGHYDGGLGQLMQGTGSGKLEPVPADMSGLVIPQDAKSATVADLNGDGKPDLLIGVNSGTYRAFHNQTSSGAYEAVGPLAPGSLVSYSIGGKPRIHEYHAGSGYLSQNPNQVLLGGKIDAGSVKISPAQ
jgi:enediyne biosynthesis protein E4